MHESQYLAGCQNTLTLTLQRWVNVRVKDVEEMTIQLLGLDEQKKRKVNSVWGPGMRVGVRRESPGFVGKMYFVFKARVKQLSRNVLQARGWRWKESSGLELKQWKSPRICWEKKKPTCLSQLMAVGGREGEEVGESKDESLREKKILREWMMVW